MSFPWELAVDGGGGAKGGAWGGGGGDAGDDSGGGGGVSGGSTGGGIRKLGAGGGVQRLEPVVPRTTGRGRHRRRRRPGDAALQKGGRDRSDGWWSMDPMPHAERDSYSKIGISDPCICTWCAGIRE